ncbi:MAG: PstS family phosphate ABC transporter substrate-binding protein [Pseudobdellovibrionaceae bacterium]
MKHLLLAAALLASSASFADTKTLISGSDTMGGLMTDAIIASGLDQVIGYVGGGSSVGEKAFINGEIGMAAMSREMTPAAIAQARAAGLEPIAHVVALDGIALFVNKSNSTIGIDFPTLIKVYTCEITSWNQIPGSGKSGAIHVFRRDDKSGTTDTFKSLVGIKTFGACVQILAETADIAEKTGQDAAAIGYAGLSAKTDRNRTLLIARSGTAYVAPNVSTIRNKTYPLSRSLYIYEVSGAKSPNKVEAQLLEQLLDRSFLDPIVQDHDFITID